MKKSISKKAIVYIALFIMMVALGFNKAYAKYYNSDEKIMMDVSKYMVEENGERYFDLEKAKKDNVRDEVIDLGNLVNDLASEWGFRQDREVKFRSLFPIGSYGNFCGKGNNGWDKYPIDDLDAACKGHDKCFVWGGDNTACNTQFCKELDWVIKFAQDGYRKKAYAMAAKVLFGCSKYGY